MTVITCPKCGEWNANPKTPRCHQCGGLLSEVASGAQPPKAVSPSATGCRGATAPSNPEADSSVRCRDKAESERRTFEPLTAVRQLKMVELQKAAVAYVECLQGKTSFENVLTLTDSFFLAAESYAEAKRREDAPPCGERARLDNGLHERPGATTQKDTNAK